MKRILTGLLSSIGFALLMTGSTGALMTWSTSASAQTVSCTSTTCTYGLICVDAWGGCYNYTWKIASAHNNWTESNGGVANVVKLCEPDGTNCVLVDSGIELMNTDTNGNDLGTGVPNVVIICQVPGAPTCTDGQCGGSPNSSGAVFLNTTYIASSTSALNQDACVRQRGGVKCSKDNTLVGLEGDAAAAAAYCPNPNWIISHWYPLNFEGTTTVSGPTDKKLDQGTTTAVTRCWLRDPNGLYPWEPGYQLSSNLTDNKLICQPGLNTNS
jgi:hypothetical protein